MAARARCPPRVRLRRMCRCARKSRRRCACGSACSRGTRLTPATGKQPAFAPDPESCSRRRCTCDSCARAHRAWHAGSDAGRRDEPVCPPLFAAHPARALTLARLSLREAMQAAQKNGEVSFEEARALRWLSDPRNAAPLAPAAAAPPPYDEVANAAAAASPAAPSPPAPEPPVVAAHAPIALEEVAAPQQAAVAEAPQVAPLTCAAARPRCGTDIQQAQVPAATLPASSSLDAAMPRFPSACLQLDRGCLFCV